MTETEVLRHAVLLGLCQGALNRVRELLAHENSECSALTEAWDDVVFFAVCATGQVDPSH